MSYSRHEATDSFCCSGTAVRYWWVDGATKSDSDAIDTVLDAVEAMLETPGWELRDMAVDDEIGFIRALLQRAAAGRLAPITEIKAIRRQAMERLFEIRHEIHLLDRKLVMGKVMDTRPRTELMRAYHAEEPVHLPRNAIGLHVHLKEVADDARDTEAFQDESIDRAVAVLDAGRDTKWGIR